MIVLRARRLQLLVSCGGLRANRAGDCLSSDACFGDNRNGATWSMYTGAGGKGLHCSYLAFMSSIAVGCRTIQIGAYPLCTSAYLSPEAHW